MERCDRVELLRTTYTLVGLKEMADTYDALPDDLTIRILWVEDHPCPNLPIVCKDCGKTINYISVSWRDAVVEVEQRGRDINLPVMSLCEDCDESEENEE